MMLYHILDVLSLYIIRSSIVSFSSNGTLDYNTIKMLREENTEENIIYVRSNDLMLIAQCVDKSTCIILSIIAPFTNRALSILLVCEI